MVLRLTRRSQASPSLRRRRRPVASTHRPASRVSSLWLLELLVVDLLLRVRVPWRRPSTLRRLSRLPVHVTISALLLPVPPAAVLLVVVVVAVVPLLVLSLIVSVAVVLLVVLLIVARGLPSGLRASLLVVLLLSRLLVVVVLLLLVCHGARSPRMWLRWSKPPTWF